MNIYLNIYMNKKICNLIIKNKEKFIPLLFTEKQVLILKNYFSNLKLSNTEKVYLYSTIKKKIDALNILREEFYVIGDGMIKERVEKAKDIIKELHKERSFISGSFLFSQKYNDIDIYIISNRKKQYHRGKNHFIFLTEKDLKKPIFISSIKYCVSNFFIEEIDPLIKIPSFNDFIIAYEMAINEALDNDDQKEIRSLIFEYNLQIKGMVLDSHSLFKEFNKIIRLNQYEKIKLINSMAKEILLKSYSRSYLYSELLTFIKRLEESVVEFKANENLKIYIDLLNEVKDECRRAET